MLDKPVLLLESDTVPNAAVIVTFIAHFPGEMGGYFRGSLMLLPVFPRGGADKKHSRQKDRHTGRMADGHEKIQQNDRFNFAISFSNKCTGKDTDMQVKQDGIVLYCQLKKPGIR